jgi:hypothetical protein
MAQLVIAAAGAAIGGALLPGVVAFGMTGASIGWMAGSMIGAGFGPTQKSEGPRLSDLSVSTSSYGTPIPYVAGHPRVAGQIVWASAKREIANTQSAGGKGGGGSEYTTYTYEMDLLVLLTDNVIANVSRIWSNGELIYTGTAKAGVWSRMTVYTGSSSQLADPTYEAAVGTANAPAYRGRGSVFIQSLQLGGSGQIPNLTFEVCTAASTAAQYGDLLIRYNDVASQWQNKATGLAVTSLVGQTSAPVVGYPIQVDAVRTIGGLKTAKMNAFMSSTRPSLNSSNDGACFTPTIRIPFTGSTTVECFVYLDSADTQAGGWLFNDGGLGYSFATPSNYLAVPTQGCFSCFITSLGVVHFFTGKGQATTDALKLHLTASSVPFDQWAHVAFVRVGTTWTVYINGVNSASGVELQTPSVYGTWYIGALWSQSTPYGSPGGFVGNMAEFRIFTTVAIYTSNFSVPSAPLQYISVTPLDVTLQSVVSSQCQLAKAGTAWFDTTALSTITQPVRSMAISQVSSARTVLEMLAQTYHFDAVLSDKIYFKPRATASVATLTFDELGVGIDPNADPLPLTTANELEIPAQMALTYNNVAGDYQTDTQYSDRLLTGQESTSAITVPLGFTASEAKQIVDGTLLDKAVSGLTTKVQLGITRAALEPTDVVVITGDDSSTYRMRVVKRTESAGMIDLECVKDDATVFTQAGSTSGGTASQTAIAILATTTLVLMDLPCLRDADNQPGLYAAVTGSSANWTSAAIYDSLDNVTYTTQTTVSTQAPLGTCTTTLGAWTGGNTFDETNTCTVNVGLQQLASTTWDGILANTDTNAALVGSELIQYRVATLVSAGVYTLSGLLRGRKGTSSTGHVAAERFVALSTTAGLRFLALQSADLARLRYYKGVSASQALSAVTAQSITPLGNTLKPFAPVDARANRATTDTVLTWVRQTRLSTRIVGTLPMSIPLGETTESYEVEVWDSGYTTLKRTLTASTPTVTYTSANQVTDFGSNQATLYLKIYQLSAIVGRGNALTVSV